MRGITLADVNRLCTEYIKNRDRTWTHQAPQKDKASLASEAEVLGWLQSVEAEELQPYQDNTRTATLLTSMPVAGKVVKEETDKPLNITTLRYCHIRCKNTGCR